MREKDVRRLPVVDDGKAIGIVSLGGYLDPDRARIGVVGHQRRQAGPLNW